MVFCDLQFFLVIIIKKTFLGNFPGGNLQRGSFIGGNFVDTSHTILVDTGRKLNVDKTFRARPGRLLNVLCTFSLRPVSTVILTLNLKTEILYSGF